MSRLIFDTLRHDKHSVANARLMLHIDIEQCLNETSVIDAAYDKAVERVRADVQAVQDLKQAHTLLQDVVTANTMLEFARRWAIDKTWALATSLLDIIHINEAGLSVSVVHDSYNAAATVIRALLAKALVTNTQRETLISAFHGASMFLLHAVHRRDLPKVRVP